MDKEFSIGSRVMAALALAAVLGFTSDDAASDDTRHLFRCELRGTPTYSDTACDLAANKIEINPDRLNTYDATETPHHFAAKREVTAEIERREAASASIAEEQMKHKQRCKEIASRVDAVTDQMRQGTSARGTADRANRLRERQREIEEQKRTEKCH